MAGRACRLPVWGRDAYLATAALVMEIVSPDDQTWEKLDFYAAHHVDERLIVDVMGAMSGAGTGARWPLPPDRAKRNDGARSR